MRAVQAQDFNSAPPHIEPFKRAFISIKERRRRSIPCARKSERSMITLKHPGFPQAATWLCFLLLVALATANALSAQETTAKALPAKGVESSSPPSSPSASPPDSAASGDQTVPRKAPEIYLIGPGDMLAINVWKEAELTKSMPVRPDGRISLPLIGDIQAAGLTAAQLQQAILKRLSVYMSNPQVNVIVQQIRSRSFNVVGKVNKPGEYDLTSSKTVLDALALAGGFQDFARVKKIYVLRHLADGTTKMLPFNYRQVIKGNGLGQNVELQPGDTVVVP